MRDNEDKMRALLREQAYDAGESEWFTPRVLNRLPARRERRRHRQWALMCAVAALMCAGCWVWLISGQDRLVLTVRDLVHYCVMCVITAAVAWQSLTGVMSRD